MGEGATYQSTRLEARVPLSALKTGRRFSEKAFTPPGSPRC